MSTGTGSLQAVTRESFESDQKSWRLAEKDCQVSILGHQRVLEGAHSGQGCEFLRLQTGQGTKVLFAHEVTPSRVISDLSPSVWVRADNPGIQLLARIVLPNTKDPQRDGPLTTLIYGDFYTDTGVWQQLTLADCEQALMRQLPLLRKHFGPSVDAKGAFLDLVVLNAYTSRRSASIWIDDLEVRGHVQAKQALNTANEPGSDGIRRPVGSAPDAVSMKGSVIEVASRPYFARIIEHNGESFEWLRSLGFNTIQLRMPPTQRQLSEARRLGIWLVAPPPQILGRSRLDLNYDRVLAWHLGEALTQTELEATRRIAADVRQMDPMRGRPMVCAADAKLWHYSRFAEIMQINHAPLGSTLDLAEFATWLRHRGRLVRGRTAIWTSIQTEALPKLVEQVRALDPGRADAIAVEPSQLRMLMYHAISSGSRGVLFRSSSRLDAGSRQAQLRLSTLQLLNLELLSLEPWIASGTYAGELQSTSPDIDVSVIETQRSRLLIVLRNARGQQFVTSSHQPITISLLDSGAPSSAMAYQVSPSSGLRKVTHWRKPGGIRIKLDNFDAIAAVVLTDDPLVRKYLAIRSGSQFRTAANLQHELATRWLENTPASSLTSASEPATASSAYAARALRAAQETLRQSERLLNSGDYESAYRAAQHAVRHTSSARHAVWQQEVADFPAPSASPFCRNFDALPVHRHVSRQMKLVQWSANLLSGGDCEDLAGMKNAGWRNHRYADDSVVSEVRLSPEAAYVGRTGLLMRCQAKDAEAAPDVLESPPSWIESARVRVQAGQIARIHGWVRVDKPIQGSLDGVLIFDSIGGIQLAERLVESGQWQEFTMYRVVPRDGDLTVTFALSGPGEAWLDDVSIMLTTPLQSPTQPAGSTDTPAPFFTPLP